jgi:hypothetical protein
MDSETAGESLVVRLDGVFDIAAAQRVLGLLAEATPGAEVYIDVTHVREFHDHGVAKLAEGLLKAPLRVSLRGLRNHQYRMLRYLGVSSSALDPGFARRSSTYTSDAF